MNRSIAWATWIIAGALLGGALGIASVRDGMADSHAKTSAADVGRAFYEQHCAVCHGQDGRGGGEFAELLKVPPPDLTTIAERRGGVFPAMEIAESIEGTRTARAHGNPEMPVWGERFSEARPSGQGGRTAMRGRVFLLVEYLRSIQTDVAELEPEKPETPETPRRTVADVGRERFGVQCSACHGLEGKGDGYVGVLLEKPPADLTQIAARRGGTFPALEVAEIIDGRRAVRAHGPREMPVWGERFTETQAPGVGRQSAVRGEVLLYVEFLRSIQAP